MLNRLASLFRRRPPPPAFDVPLAPAAPFYAVGDIHGRADLLAALLERIGQDRKERDRQEAPLIFLGDYVDRGPDSAGVLERLHQSQRAAPGQVTCLKGNHEKMLLEFIDDPVSRGGRWLRNGGVRTLASFDISISERAGADDLMEASSAFQAALPQGMESWLRALPLRWQSGNICCVHAAMDPEIAPQQQDERVLLWGHPEFFVRARGDGLWVVHGHTIVPLPEQAGGRIALDTGAYRSGRLSGAALAPGECRFL